MIISRSTTALLGMVECALVDMIELPDIG